MDERTIDRQIAERLGWRDFFTRDDWFESPENGPYEITRLHGTPPKSWIPTEQLYHDKPVPCYSTDMNAAVQLLKLMPLGAVGIDEDGKTWFCSAFMDGAGVVADATADTPTLAICQAYLAYTENKAAS